MKLLKMSSRLCGIIFLLTCLVLCGVLAWKIGAENAIESVWVPREKIIGAEPYTKIDQVNVQRGLLFGVPVFLVGSLFSLALSELFFAALTHFRGERRGGHDERLE